MASSGNQMGCQAIESAIESAGNLRVDTFRAILSSSILINEKPLASP